MISESKVNSLVALGLFLKKWALLLNANDPTPTDPFLQKAMQASHAAKMKNAWFDLKFIELSLQSWADALTKEKIEKWLSGYSLRQPPSPKKVGLVLAGNIPLVGLHDVLSVLISGHIAQIKWSSDDALLMPIVLEFLVDLNPEFNNCILQSPGIIKEADAFIATGSNNSARYFDYYFSKKPSLIRKNRSSVAILTGKESKKELTALGKDIFSYFGLGCRNVSKLLVPEGYIFNDFFESIVDYGWVVNNNKYGNNYDYHRAIYLLDSVPMLDNNFLLLKPDSAWSSPIGVLFHDAYKNENDLKEKLHTANKQLQCMVGNPLSGIKTVPFGRTQQPELTDYADGIDTMKFLTDL
jgi:hypothetical protein